MKESTQKHPKKPSLRVVVKYFLLQLPGLLSFVLIAVLLQRWLEIPSYLMWALIFLWAGKDAVLFFFLWRFYDPSLQTDRYQMVGRKGVALTRLDPSGFVQVRAERWLADLAEKSPPVEQGQTVCVVAARGLRLTVRDCPEDRPEQ